MAFPLLLGIEATCRELNCGKTFLFELLKNKEIDSVMIGNRRKIVSASLLEYIERLKTEEAV